MFFHSGQTQQITTVTGYQFETYYMQFTHNNKNNTFLKTLFKKNEQIH